MQNYSAASERAYVLKPERSRWLTAWSLALHGLLALVPIASAWPLPVSVACSGLVLIHMRLRRQLPNELIVYAPAGPWALPQSGRFGFDLAPETRFTGFWVELVLARGRERVRLVLLRDQFDAEAWHRLQIAVREPL